MPDPVSLIALGAAVGGAAGKFTERAWDAGSKWLASYYANHKEKALEKAQQNSSGFLIALANKVRVLEEQQEVSKEAIESAQDHPDFSVLLQKALLASAQTESKDKHELLARLVAERLKVNPESRLAVVTKLACDAVPGLTAKQLQVLGLLAQITYVQNQNQLSKTEYLMLLQHILQPYDMFAYDGIDIIHLEALSCVKHISFSENDLKGLLTKKNRGVIDWDVFISTDFGKRILELWNKPGIGLTGVSLTSIGVLIGVYVSDMLTKTRTDFGDL